MATGEDIVFAAYGFSSKNQPTKIADEATELVGFLNRALRAFFAIAAKVNPQFFGAVETVAIDGDNWPRPETAELVFRIEDENQEEVAIVPIEDRGAEPSLPGVYMLGRLYYARGLDNDPEGDLDFWFSRSAEALADLEDDVDIGWPTTFDQLLSLEVALYLALKDGRMEEVPDLRSRRDGQLVLFLLHVSHADVGVRRRFNIQRRHSDPGIIAVSELLAGGSSVKLGG